MEKLKIPLSFREWKKKKINEFKQSKKRYMETKNERFLLQVHDIGRGGTHFFLREDWEIFEQKNMTGTKAFVIEKLRKIKINGKSHHKGGSKKDSIEYRIGYFIVTPKNRWWWGEACPFVPKEDVSKLLRALQRMKR